MIRLRNVFAVLALTAICGTAGLGATASSPAPAAPCSGKTWHHRGHMGLLHSLDLTPQQHDKIRELVRQYRASHADGQRVDPQARAQLRRDIDALLTPQQKAELQRKLDQRKRRTPCGVTSPHPQATP